MMTKRNRTTKQQRRSGRLAAAALQEAARLGSIAGSIRPDDTAEMHNVLSTLLATEETVQDLARRFMRARAS